MNLAKGGRPMARGTFGVLLALTTFGAVAANSQAATTGDSVMLEEVVVTAEKVSQGLEKEALPVTVLSGEQLQAMGAQSFTDYLGSVPALSFESLAPGEQRILIRGVSDGVDTGLRGATQNTTGIYIDDMVVSNNQSAPDLNLFDVQRIEVLKGPQGTLYGDGSVGGLIRVITNKPDVTRTAGEIEARGGAIDHGGGDYSLNGMYNVPLVEHALALRMVAQYRDNQGFINDVRNGLKDVNNMRQTGARASLRWLPTDRLTLTGSLLLQQTDLGNDNDINGALGGGLVRNSYFQEPVVTRFNLYNLTADWDLGWADAVSASSYAVYDRDSHADFTDFLETAINADFGVPGVILPAHTESRQHSRTFSEELRLSSPTGRRLSWLAGAYFYRIREYDSELDIADGLYNFFANTLGFPIAGTPLDVGPVTDVAFNDLGSTINRREVALFGETSYHITGKVTATIGARWFHDSLMNTDNPGGVFQGSPIVHLQQRSSDHSQVFRYRVADQLSDITLIYALASQGYRTGGLNPLNPATLNNPAFPQAFQPDKLWNYEVGLKTLRLDRRLRLNGAVFFIDWSNEQVELALPSGFDVIANAGKTQISGLEGELAFRPTGELEVGLNASYTRAKLARNLYGNNGILVGQSGDQLTGVPKLQGSAYGQWDFPIKDGVRGVVRGDVQYVGRTQRFYAHDSRVSAPADLFEAYGDYAMVNLRGGLQWPDFSAMLFIDNVADRRAVLFRGLQGTSVTGSRDDVFVAQPRTIGVEVTKSF